MTKEQIKVIHLPNQFNEKEFNEGCKEILELIGQKRQIKG